MGHVTLTISLLGKFFIRRLGLAMANLYAKFEVSICTNYEDTKSRAKCTNWGGFGRLGVTQGHRQNKRQNAYDFLFNFNRNYASTLYRFRDIASYLWKVANFNLPHLHLVLPLVEFRWDLWRQKTRVPVLSCGFVCVILYLAVLTQYWLVIDRQMDTDTGWQHIQC